MVWVTRLALDLRRRRRRFQSLQSSFQSFHEAKLKPSWSLERCHLEAVLVCHSVLVRASGKTKSSYREVKPRGTTRKLQGHPFTKPEPTRWKKVSLYQTWWIIPIFSAPPLNVRHRASSLRYIWRCKSQATVFGLVSLGAGPPHLAQWSGFRVLNRCEILYKHNWWYNSRLKDRSFNKTVFTAKARRSATSKGLAALRKSLA